MMDRGHVSGGEVGKIFGFNRKMETGRGGTRREGKIPENLSHLPTLRSDSGEGRAVRVGSGVLSLVGLRLAVRIPAYAGSKT